MQEYKEEVFGCHGRVANHVHSSPFILSCDTLPLSEIEVRFHQDPFVSFVVKAISALTAAFRLVQLDHCQDDFRQRCLHDVRRDLHEDIVNNLRKLSFSAMMTSKDDEGHQFEGTQHHFARNGRLVANKQQVYLIDRNFGLKQVRLAQFLTILLEIIIS